MANLKDTDNTTSLDDRQKENKHMDLRKWGLSRAFRLSRARIGYYREIPEAAEALNMLERLQSKLLEEANNNG